MDGLQAEAPEDSEIPASKVYVKAAWAISWPLVLFLHVLGSAGLLSCVPRYPCCSSPVDLHCLGYLTLCGRADECIA